MELDVVAVVPLFGRGDGGLDRRIFNFADALKLVTQDVCFGEQLFFVREILVVASAALGEVFAFGLDAICRRFEDFNDFATGEVLFFLGELNPNRLTGQAEGNEDGTPV